MEIVHICCFSQSFNALVPSLAWQKQTTFRITKLGSKWNWRTRNFPGATLCGQRGLLQLLILPPLLYTSHLAVRFFTCWRTTIVGSQLCRQMNESSDCKPLLMMFSPAFISSNQNVEERYITIRKLLFRSKYNSSSKNSKSSWKVTIYIPFSQTTEIHTIY